MIDYLLIGYWTDEPCWLQWGEETKTMVYNRGRRRKK